MPCSRSHLPKIFGSEITRYILKLTFCNKNEKKKFVDKRQRMMMIICIFNYDDDKDDDNDNDADDEEKTF